MPELIDLNGYTLFYDIDGLNVDLETRLLLDEYPLIPYGQGILLRPTYVRKSLWKLMTFSSEFNDAFADKEVKIRNEYGIFHSLVVPVPLRKNLSTILVISL